MKDFPHYSVYSLYFSIPFQRNENFLVVPLMSLGVSHLLLKHIRLLVLFIVVVFAHTSRKENCRSMNFCLEWNS